MTTYRLTVTVDVEADHLFPAVFKVEDALKDVGLAYVSWDREDPVNATDFAGAAALLGPATETSYDASEDSPRTKPVRIVCQNTWGDS